jgi:pimeloyl-ACP methyl ester carboxylesterase
LIYTPDEGAKVTMQTCAPSFDRRHFSAMVAAAAILPVAGTQAQTGHPVRHIRTGSLDIAYEESGSATGFPVILLHGFPYDVRAFDEVAPVVAASGHRAIVPWLRGYGDTRFLSPSTMRSGQQAAVGRDLLDFMDALRIRSAVLVGFDWGARAACIVAALWPERVSGLVSCSGYAIQDIAASKKPVAPEQEFRLWYQYYFHSERGRAGLQANRHDLCKLLWKLWSPNWKFDDATYDRTALSFNNPDFVDVVIHSYRHRFGYVAGDPAFEPVEAALAKQPAVTVPSIVLQGGADGVNGSAPQDLTRFFTGQYQRRVIPLVGHDVPQEAPRETAGTALELLERLKLAPIGRGK